MQGEYDTAAHHAQVSVCGGSTGHTLSALHAGSARALSGAQAVCVCAVRGPTGCCGPTGHTHARMHTRAHTTRARTHTRARTYAHTRAQVAHDATLKAFGRGSLLLGHRCLRLGVARFAQSRVSEAAGLLHTARETLTVGAPRWWWW